MVVVDWPIVKVCVSYVDELEVYYEAGEIAGAEHPYLLGTLSD